jgi:hypothetical protein
MKKMKFPLIALLVAGLFTIAFIGCKKDLKDPSVTSDAAPKKTKSTKYGPVSIGCVSADQTSITLSIKADATTGAPAGFSIQWMTQANFDAIGDVWPLDTTSFCKASFSGKAYGIAYSLGAGDSVNITLGDPLYEFANGATIQATAGCNGPLTCGTQYVFRAFAHGDNVMNRSDFSLGYCETAQCDESCGRHWLGWWKQDDNFHGQTFTQGIDLDAPFMTLGTNSYSANQIFAILNADPKGNGLIILSHQLISAKLNLMLAGGDTFNDATVAGDAAIGSKVVPPTNGSTTDLKYNTINLPKLVGDLHAFNVCD